MLQSPKEAMIDELSMQINELVRQEEAIQKELNSVYAKREMLILLLTRIENNMIKALG
jgi:hypothetical protein